MAMAKCKQCNKELRNPKNKFCGTSCAASFNNRRRKHSKKTRTKISDKLKKYFEENGIKIKPRRCKFCQEFFDPKRNKRKYCSVECTLMGRKRTKKDLLSKRTLTKILVRAFPDWHCPFCDWKETFHVHHIVPRRKGGSNDLNNLVMICPNHHSLADPGVIEQEKLSEYSIGKHYTERKLLNLFYHGQLTEFKINW